MKDNHCIVLSGPSGVGKTTVVQQLINQHPHLYVQTVSCTTRTRRNAETDGVDYYFLSEEAFKRKVDHDEFLEHVSFSGNYYGTLRSEVETLKKTKKIILLIIDIQGGARIKSALSDSVFIFITPPSLEVLKQRLVGRSSESKDSLEQRLKRADEEMKHAVEYNYVIENDNLNDAVDNLHQLLQKL